MRKIFLTAVILTLGQYIFSQNDSNYLALGLYINPNIMYRTAWIKPSYEGDIDYEKYLKDDFPIFGYNYGVSIIWKRFQIGDIEAGIYLSQRGNGFISKVMVPDSIANFQYDPGFPYPEEFQVKDVYNFIDIPLLLKRNILIGEKITLYGKGGLGMNILLNNKRRTHIYYIDETQSDNYYDFKLNELKDRKYRNLYFSFSFSFGVSIPITQNINIQSEAILNHFILPKCKGGDVAVRLFETGIKTGISYKF